MARYIDTDALKRKLIDKYNFYPDIVARAIEEVLKLNQLSPCDVCAYNPPSSLDGKPCTICPASART